MLGLRRDRLRRMQHLRETVERAAHAHPPPKTQRALFLLTRRLPPRAAGRERSLEEARAAAMRQREAWGKPGAGFSAEEGSGGGEKKAGQMEAGSGDDRALAELENRAEEEDAMQEPAVPRAEPACNEPFGIPTAAEPARALPAFAGKPPRPPPYEPTMTIATKGAFAAAGGMFRVGVFSKRGAWGNAVAVASAGSGSLLQQ